MKIPESTIILTGSLNFRVNTLVSELKLLSSIIGLVLSAVKLTVKLLIRCEEVSVEITL